MTRLPAMDALDRKRARETQDDYRNAAGKRSKVGELHPDLGWVKEVATEHAQWWNPILNDEVGSTQRPHLERAEAAVSA